MKKIKLDQITAEDYKKWIWPKQRNFIIGCCDCGLAHSYNFRVIEMDKRLVLNPQKYQIEFQIKTNPVMTAYIKTKIMVDK